jgi:uncharacterized protein (DUF427 family)
MENILKQESVWDYPRPPKYEQVPQRLKVIFNNTVIADTTLGYRILETSHPPTYYIPPEDIKMDYLIPEEKTSFCEFKGMAVYWTLKVDGQISKNAAWSYPAPSSKFEHIRNYLCFYATKVQECYVGDEKVAPQEGDFYGGWITQNLKGPFKGGKGTWGW